MDLPLLISYVGRGRGNSRNSGSRGKSSSRTLKNVKCWNCQEVGHVKSQYPKKELNIADAENFSGDDALLLSVESNVDYWVMDSGASFHATHINEAMKNLKECDFGKVRLGNGEILEVTGMGDIELKTTLGTTWCLLNVRVIPKLETKLISVGQLDDQGLDVKFGGGKWKVLNDNRVIAQGFKQGSLYMVSVPFGDVNPPVKMNYKVGFAKSSRAKRVQFANLNLGATEMFAERVRKSKLNRGFGNSGSMGRVPCTGPKQQWVCKTGKPNVKVSPRNSLLNLESVYPLKFSGVDGTRLWPVGVG